MKFVYFGYDFMLGSVRRLLGDGHELIGVMSFECDNVFNFNHQTQALAEELGIPFHPGRAEAAHIDTFLAEGCECFLSAGYPFKIPPIDESKAYGVNFHPTLLPLGRGIMPAPYVIMRHPEAGGMTWHKLTPQFDAGDILYQEALPAGPRETVETLSARIILRAPEVFSMLMADLPKYWGEAAPQDENKASHWNMPDDNMRVFNWAGPVAEIDKVGRAFGHYGSIASFDNQHWAVYGYHVWQEKHGFTPGDVACRMGNQVVIAAKDGFVCLTQFQPIPSA